MSHENEHSFAETEYLALLQDKIADGKSVLLYTFLCMPANNSYRTKT